MSYWETDGYCARLREEGFSRAYDLDDLMKRVKETREEYESALQEYNYSIPNALVKPDSDGEPTHITFISDEDIDKMSSFLEKEENWKILKNCWILNGKSLSLRKLLKDAIIYIEKPYT